MRVQGTASNPLIGLLSGVLAAHKDAVSTNGQLQKQVLASVAGQTTAKRRIESEEKRNDANIAGRARIADQTDKRTRDIAAENEKLRREIADNQARLANVYAFMGKDPQSLTPEAIDRMRRMLQPVAGGPLGGIDPSALEGMDPNQTFTVNPNTPEGMVAQKRGESYDALTGQRRAQENATKTRLPHQVNLLENQSAAAGALAGGRVQLLPGQLALQRAREEQIRSATGAQSQKLEAYLSNVESLIQSRSVNDVIRAMGGIRDTNGAIGLLRVRANSMMRSRVIDGRQFPPDPEQVKRGRALMESVDRLEKQLQMATPAGLDPSLADSIRPDPYDDLTGESMDAADMADAGGDQAPPPADAPFSLGGLFGPATPVAPAPGAPSLGVARPRGAPLPARPGTPLVIAPAPHHSVRQPRKKTGEFKKGSPKPALKPKGKPTGAGGAGKPVQFKWREPVAGKGK